MKNEKKRIRFERSEGPVISGTPALLVLPGGRKVSTSQVVACVYHSNGTMRVETEHTIYSNEKGVIV